MLSRFITEIKTIRAETFTEIVREIHKAPSDAGKRRLKRLDNVFSFLQ
jgi:hypothetical protein